MPRACCCPLTCEGCAWLGAVVLLLSALVVRAPQRGHQAPRCQAADVDGTALASSRQQCGPALGLQAPQAHHKHTHMHVHGKRGRLHERLTAAHCWLPCPPPSARTLQ
jgi:hypothetical protein